MKFRECRHSGHDQRQVGILGDEKHPEHQMYREWILVDYGPARFDLDEINEALAQLGIGVLQH